MKENILLEEMRLYEVNPEIEITNESLIKAMTINTELNNIGFTLLPEDVIKLASASHPEKFLDLIKKEYTHDDYKPMYPGYPKEVMEMDEAVFRFHQLIHYFSTYGVELITGKEISNGWMPLSDYEEKTEEALRLKDLTVVELASKEEIYDRVEKYIISKKERWNDNEIILATDFFAENPDKSYEIPFKENIKIYYEGLDNAHDPDMFNKLKNVCKHSGDVLDLIKMENDEHYKNFHAFSTSKRKLFTKLLDSYPGEDLSANLARENKKNKHALNLISYNKFSKNPANKETVRKFRNDELRSWNSRVEEKIQNHDKDTLDFISKRPGEYYRLIRKLLNAGFDRDEVRSHINGKDLKPQTIVNALCHTLNYDERNKEEEKKNTDNFISISKELLVESLQQHETPLTNKRVFIDKTQYSLEKSFVSVDKSDTGSYIRSGLAYDIPKNVDIVREFVFWDDRSKNVDMDLHALVFDKNGETIHIGWDGDFNRYGITTSGDITTSRNSAEYIDVNIPMALENDVKYVTFQIKYFRGSRFSDVDKCYFGIEAAKDDYYCELYDPKNLYFHHDLTTSDKNSIEYGVFDIEDRTLRLFDKKESYEKFNTVINFNLKDYLDLLAEAQNITYVQDRDEAEIVLTLDKQDGTYSLLDKNFLIEGDKEYEEQQKNRIQETKDGLTKFSGSLEECNDLLREFGGNIGKEGENFFWKGKADKEEVSEIIKEWNEESRFKNDYISRQ